MNFKKNNNSGDKYGKSGHQLLTVKKIQINQGKTSNDCILMYATLRKQKEKQNSEELIQVFKNNTEKRKYSQNQNIISKIMLYSLLQWHTVMIHNYFTQNCDFHAGKPDLFSIFHWIHTICLYNNKIEWMGKSVTFISALEVSRGKEIVLSFKLLQFLQKIFMQMPLWVKTVRELGHFSSSVCLTVFAITHILINLVLLRQFYTYLHNSFIPSKLHFIQISKLISM